MIKCLKNIPGEKLYRLISLLITSLFFLKLGHLSQLVPNLHQNNGLHWHSDQDMLDGHQRGGTQPHRELRRQVSLRSLVQLFAAAQTYGLNRHRFILRIDGRSQECGRSASLM